MSANKSYLSAIKIISFVSGWQSSFFQSVAKLDYLLKFVTNRKINYQRVCFMAKVKYKFNPETLSYDKVTVSFSVKLKRFFTYLSSAVVLAVIMVVVFLHYYESPRMKIVSKENQRLETQYELLYKDLGTLEEVLDEIQQRDDNLYRVIFEADPIPSSIRKAGFGGTNKYSQLESFTNSELVIRTAKKLDILSKQAYIQSKSYDEVMKLALNKEKMLASIPAIMPIFNKDLARTSSGFGFRMHPIYKIWKFHEGQDFTGPSGTDVYATGNGVVKGTYGNKRSKVGFGQWIVIDHGYGYETLYGHLSAFNVKKGQKVKRGDVIGYIGNTGCSTGPHLHYEVHKDRKPVDPAFFFYKDLSPDEYEKMIAISSNAGQALD